MNEHEITTAHNVTLRLSLASIGHRIVACFIDNLIKAGYIVAVLLFVSFIIRLKFSDLTVLSAAVLFILALPVFFYSLFFEYYMGGQTPGKRSMKIKVASLKNDELTVGQCLIRWLFRLPDLNIMPGIGLITILVTSKRQRGGDLIAGTIVVNLKSEKTLDQTIYTQVGVVREARYPQAARLSAREIEIIKEVLSQYEKGGTYDLIPMTASRVRDAISAGEEYDDLSFLQAVVQDYYILAAQ